MDKLMWYCSSLWTHNFKHRMVSLSMLHMSSTGQVSSHGHNIRALYNTLLAFNDNHTSDYSLHSVRDVASTAKTTQNKIKIKLTPLSFSHVI